MAPPGDPPLARSPSHPARGNGEAAGTRDSDSGPYGDPTAPDPPSTIPDPAPTESRSDEGGTGPESGNDELILQEIDRLREELASRSTVVRQDARPPEIAEWDESNVGPTREPPGLEVSSPYLDERLTVARTLATRLAEEAGNVERGLQGLRTALETMDQELGRAAEELSFVRSRSREGPASVPGDLSLAEVRPTASAPRPGGVRPARGPPPRVPDATGSFGDFTVARYNLTVSDLQARRRATLWVVLVLAAAISGALLFLTLRAREPVPVVWLAVLPLVWMIPVPFFVVAFRGTHRVLRQNRLDLPEE